MPTEPLFQGVTFKDSRDYKGLDFKAYLTPNSYQPLSAFTGFGKYDDIIDQGRLVAINQPYPMSYNGYTQDQVKSSQVSPSPINFGTYTENTRINMYYWLGLEQLSTSFVLIPFRDVQIDQLSDKESRTLLQNILVWIAENISNRIAERLQRESEKETSNQGKWQKIIDWFKSNRAGNAVGVWIQSGRAIEPLSVVTGVQFENNSNGLPNRNGLPNKRTPPNPVEKTKTNPLPYIVSGLGLAMGSPSLIGAGLLLRYLAERGKND